MTNGYNKRNKAAIEKSKSFREQLSQFSKSSEKKGRKSKPIDEREVTKKVLSDYVKSAEYKKNIDKIRRLERQQRYEKTSAGKIGRGIAKGVQFARRPTATAYASQMPVNIGRGRPKGSLSNKYAAFGGVKRYRKFLAEKNRLDRTQRVRDASLSPEERNILSKLRQRQQYDSLAMERRTFPDTTGQFDFSTFTREINDASNSVG